MTFSIFDSEATRKRIRLSSPDENGRWHINVSTSQSRPTEPRARAESEDNADSASDIDEVEGNQRFDVKKWFEKFTAKGTKRLLNGKDLRDHLTSVNEPFARSNKNFIIGNRVFILGLWDRFLEQFFLRTNSEGTLEGQRRLENFFKEILQNPGNEFDANLFKDYVVWINKREVVRVVKCHWYDLPASLRIVAPLSETLRCSDFSGEQFYFMSILRGLPFRYL